MKEMLIQKRWTTACALGLLTLMLVATMAVTFSEKVSSNASVFFGATGSGFDALTTQEQSNVLSATLDAISDPNMVSAAAVATQEILLIERHQEKKDVYLGDTWSRRGDAYIYDYATDTLIYALMNLDTGDVETVEKYQGIQLPLTENEIERSLDVAYANEALRTKLEAQFQAITGEALHTLEQLNVKAFVFLADSMPENLNSAAQQCGLHRCAQLLLFTNEDISFEIQPIVDLSTAQVVQILGE